MLQNVELYRCISENQQPSSVVLEKQLCQLSHKTLVQGVPALNNGSLFVLLNVCENSDLFICDLHNTNSNSGKSSNFYLVFKMFWHTDTVTSQVCWANNTQIWIFSKVVQVQLSEALLERLRCNYVVLEVWHKQMSTVSDQLIGLVKLPLHQLFLSFRDPTVAQALLFAVGSPNQVARVQDMKRSNEKFDYGFNECEKISSSLSVNTSVPECELSFYEHVFMVRLEDLRELQLPEASVTWGEADFLYSIDFRQFLLRHLATAIHFVCVLIAVLRLWLQLIKNCTALRVIALPYLETLPFSNDWQCVRPVVMVPHLICR